MKKTILYFILVMFAIIIGYVNLNRTGNYIWKAYFYPGSDSSLRGYPIIYEPKNFTGTWIDYTYTGRVLATRPYVNGVSHGNEKYYDDDGNIYYSRVYNNGEVESHGEAKGAPPKTTIPWFFPQRWINRSLDRLAIWDKLFKPKPIVHIGETPEDQNK